MTENDLRKKLKAGKIKPRPKGTLSTGWIVGIDKPIKSRCRDHLFVVRQAVPNKNWQSSFSQGAYCLVCREEMVSVDSSIWYEKANKKDIQKCMALLKKRANEDKALYLKLKKRVISDEA